MYHHRVLEHELPPECSHESLVSFGDGGIIYQEDTSHIFWCGESTTLKLEQRLTFAEEESGVMVVSGDNGTEIITETAHFATEETCRVCCWDQCALGTIEGELFEFDIAEEQVRSICSLDSEIIEIFHSQIGIVVSTLTKLVVLPDREIGTKLRKNTRHGGCEYLDKILVCRPSLKIFVFEKSANEIVKTIALRESVPELSCEYCQDSRDADLGILFHFAENVLVSFEKGECIVIDIEQPCIVEHISLPSNARFIGKRALWLSEENIHVFEIMKKVMEEVQQESVHEEQEFTEVTEPSQVSQSFPQNIHHESAEDLAPPMVALSEKTVDGKSPSLETTGESSAESPSAPSELMFEFTYTEFCELETVPEDIIPFSKLEYVPHFKFHKYTAPQNEEPLNYFFPFLPQPAVDYDSNTLASLSSQLAENYFALSETPYIQQISLSELNLETYEQLDSLTVRKLRKWLEKDAPRAVELLTRASPLDPLYPHVRQMLSTLATKAVFSLCFARDFISEQPLRRQVVFDVFDTILPPEDLYEFVLQHVTQLDILLQTYPRAFLALVFRLPQVLRGDDRMLSSEQREFVDLLNHGTQRVRALNLTMEQARAYCGGIEDNELIASVYQLFCGARRLFGEHLSSWIDIYLLPQLENVEAYVRWLFLSVFYTFIDVRVQVIAKCRLALEIEEKIVLRDQIARQLLAAAGPGFDADIEEFLGNAVQRVNINTTLLELLRETDQLQIFSQYFAERGEIEGSLELATNPETRYNIYTKLLETADSSRVVERFLVGMEGKMLQKYVEAAVGWVPSEFLYQHLKRNNQLSVRLLNALARGK